MASRAEAIHREAYMLGTALDEHDRELLRAAQHYIAVALGDRPRPARDMDMAADAYAAKTGELVE